MNNQSRKDEITSVSSNSQRRKFVRRLSFLFALMLIALVLVYLFHRFSQSAEGTIRIIPPEHTVLNPDVPPILATHEKQYFSLILPNTYTEKERETDIAPGATLREQAYFSDPTGNLRKVAVTIDEKPGITPQDLTSYTYRKLHPEIYQEKKLSWKNQEIIIFEKNDPVYEIVAYIPGGDHLMASIAIVSAYEAPEKLIGDFSEILSLFEWTHK